MKKASILLACLAVVAVGLAACGSDDSGTGAPPEPTTGGAPTGGGAPSGAGGTVSLTAAADNSFAYDATSLSAKPGTVTINFSNPATLEHDVRVEDGSGTELGKTDLIAGTDTSATVDLAAGSYTFFCSVPGHREGGMEGTLTVE